MIWLVLVLSSANDFRVNEIEVTGNEYYEASKIRSVMLTKTAALFRKGRFRKRIFDGDIEAIENLYLCEGFLDAEVTHEMHFDSTNKTVEILLRISEGEQSFVESMSFEGVRLFHEDSLRQKLQLKPGQPLDPRKVEIDNNIIESLYDDRGYADVTVNSEYVVEDQAVHVMHEIVEGEKQYVDKIEILGLKRTRESFVRRELKFKQDDVFRYARLLESQRNLYRLGIFTSIRIQVEASTKPDHKNVRFVLTEKEAMRVNVRVGYGTKDYVRLGLGFTHLNVFGRAWQGEVEGKWSFKEQRITMQMTFPRTFMLPGRLNVGTYYRTRKEIGYRPVYLGGYITTQFGLMDSRMSIKYDVERVRTYYESDDNVTSEILHAIMVSWQRDKRDNPFYTKRGHYTNANIEINGIILPSDVDLVKPTMQFRFYIPVWRLVFGTVLRAGFVEEFAPTEEVPIYKRFFCGGASSVRGYSERAIGPVDENGNPLGGKYLGTASLELRFPIHKIVGGVVFIDGGNIWQEREEISGHLRWGIGGGLRLKSFLGSIRLDYGFKIQRETDEPAGALHFAIGEAF